MAEQINSLPRMEQNVRIIFTWLLFSHFFFTDV